MDLTRNFDEVAFQQEVRNFLDSSLPDWLCRHNDSAQHSTREETLAWQRILYDRGWAAPHWPKEHGGNGWTSQQRLIFDIECAAAGAPFINQQGMGLLGPIVNAFGTSEQRARFIPPLLKGETYWCQGFSEPGAGSDLASLQTFARREGDRYVVNGQKIWTSHAHHADWIFLLLRTEKCEKKQQGISFLVAPMDLPGITVRPIRSIDGLDHLNETFFDELEVPAENLIGQEGAGWSIAKYLLGNERVFGACDLPGMMRDLGRLKKALGRPAADGRAPIDDPIAAHRLARFDMDAEAVKMSFLHAISDEGGTSVDGWAIGSILKVRVTELHQQIVEFFYEVMGDRGPLFYPSPSHPGDGPRPLPDMEFDLATVSAEVMYRRANSIHGGTNEIQRELLAKAMFGLS